MNLQESIRRIITEETEDMSPLEQTVADFVNMNLSDYVLPEEFYKISVDVFNDGYGRQECAITSLFKKPFKLDDSDRMHFIMNKIKRDVNDYFGNVFSHIAFGSSTVSNYNDTRDWYTKRKNKKINESEEKHQSLLSLIEKYGLYEFIKMSGLSMEQIILKYDNLPREVFERYIKDFIRDDGYHQTDGAVQMGYEVEISHNIYVNHFYMKGDKVTVEIRGYNDYNEQTDGYIESLSNLTDEEIFTIVDDMSQWGKDNYSDSL